MTAVCRLINNAGLFLRSDGYSGTTGSSPPTTDGGTEPRETFGASGTAMVVRAEVLDRVGLFAEPFFAYYEDTDWSWRARRLGLRRGLPAGHLGLAPALGDLGTDPRGQGPDPGRAQPAPVPGPQRPAGAWCPARYGGGWSTAPTTASVGAC